MNNHSFTRGAVILAVASITSRVLGIIYVVALPRIVHGEGMGLIQMVRPIYSFAVVISVAGLPVALSKLVAEEIAMGSVSRAKGVFCWALAIMVTFSICATGGLVFGGKWLVTRVVADPLAYPVLMAMTPSLLLMPVIAAFKGFFQGMQYMTPSAVAQVLEQAFRIASMIILAILLTPRGVEYGAIGASLGGVAGSLVGLVVLFVYYLLWHRGARPVLGAIPSVRTGEGRGKSSSGWHILRRLFALALPMVFGSLLWPIMQMLDTGLVPLRMRAANYSVESIRESLGYLGMALSAMHFPNALTTALAVTMVPAVAEAVVLNSRRLVRHRVAEALRLTMTLGIPASVGLFCLAGPASSLLFGYSEVAEPLRILAVGTLAVGVFQVCSGILQGLGLAYLPVWSLFWGVVVKFGLNYRLTAIPGLGVRGAAWGTVVGFCVAGFLNLRAVSYRTTINWDYWALLLGPVLASVIMGFAVLTVHSHLLWQLPRLLTWVPLSRHQLSSFCNGLATVVSVGIGIGVYLLGLMGTRTLCQRDIELLPVIGAGLGRWLKHRGWVR